MLAPEVQAQAQKSEDFNVMLDRMQRLERDIRTLNLQLSRGRPPAPTLQSAPQPIAPPAATGAGEGAKNVSGSGLARMSVRISGLENDLRSTTGALEDIGYQIGEIRQRLDKLVTDIDYRLGALEGRAPGAQGQGKAPARNQNRTSTRNQAPPRLTAAPSPPPVQKIIPGQETGFAQQPGNLGIVSEKAVAAIRPPSQAEPKDSKAPKAPRVRSGVSSASSPKPILAPPRATSVLPKGTPKEQYNYAFGLLRQANYDKAELALQEFVKRYPKETLASNARYWLGETYYVRAAFVQAAEVFLESYQSDPKGLKAPDSLLKLGMSLGGLEKKREACAAFNKLIKDFPDVSPGVKNTVAREKQKNGCKK
ncbi:MAG: tol-pal system protein YbgF [Rhodospirillales bacterium]|nr:tol-pal system protein YbgF [Rhodospirillales bacterium]